MVLELKPEKTRGKFLLLEKEDSEIMVYKILKIHKEKKHRAEVVLIGSYVEEYLYTGRTHQGYIDYRSEKIRGLMRQSYAIRMLKKKNIKKNKKTIYINIEEM